MTKPDRADGSWSSPAPGHAPQPSVGRFDGAAPASGFPADAGPSGPDAGPPHAPAPEPAGSAGLPDPAPGTRLGPDIPPPSGRATQRSSGSFFAELPVLVLVAFVLALVLKSFVVQAFYIPSASMEPTLLVGDRVLVNKLSWTFREPRRGEVVVFRENSGTPVIEAPPSTNPIQRFIETLTSGLGLTPPDEKDFIKRIVGLPGETIEMRGGVVYVDGRALPEAPSTEGGYLSMPHLLDFGPVTIPDGEYFMMGDNRPNSADSRAGLGTIPREDLIGRAFVVIWPLQQVSRLPIASYPGVTEPVPAAEPAAAAARAPAALRIPAGAVVAGAR